MMISKTGNKGYLLLELTITIAILSLGLVFILQAFSSSVKATGLSCDITKACFLVENKIEELEIKINKSVEVSAYEEGREANLSWNYEIITSDDNLGLKTLIFRIFRERIKKDKILEVATYLKGPS